MWAIVKSDGVEAERTRYEVVGWGVGELWTGPEVVLAHDFRFRPVSDTGAEADFGSSAVGMGRPATSRPTIARRQAASACGTIGTDLERIGLDRNRCLTPGALVERLTSFLGGEDVALDDVPIDLRSSTSFQRDVAKTLRTIPRGEVVSYGELAALAGYPGAHRAVGTFCARNRFMFLLPCHRVVAADGIGSYGSSGVEVKRRLLALEGVVL
jgi:O-6-methylguanine DNA methyltransferase